MVTLTFEIGKNMNYIRPNYDRPYFNAVTNDGASIDCLFDTGALSTIWFGTVESLRVWYPEAKLLKHVICPIGGLGNGVNIAEVCVIPEFILSDAVNKNDQINENNKIPTCTQHLKAV